MFGRSFGPMATALMVGAAPGYLAASGRWSFDRPAYAADDARPDAKAPPTGSPAATRACVPTFEKGNQIGEFLANSKEFPLRSSLEAVSYDMEPMTVRFD
jgi:hypothetical protein